MPSRCPHVSLLSKHASRSYRQGERELTRLVSARAAGGRSLFAPVEVDFFLDAAMVRTDGAGGQTCTILPQAMFFVDLAA